jgi:hypothetical protein
MSLARRLPLSLVESLINGSPNLFGKQGNRHGIERDANAPDRGNQGDATETAP